MRAKSNTFSFSSTKKQLLKNIQTMMDASVSLMNQYMMVVNRLPAAPPSTSTSSPQPSTSTASNATDAQPSADVQPTADAQPTAETQPTTEDQPATNVPSTSSKQSNAPIVTQIDDSEAGPSTSHTGKSIETYEIDGNTVTIEDIGPNDPHDSNSTQSELRRRRLERFDIKSEDS